MDIETIKLIGTYISLIGPVMAAFFTVWREVKTVHQEINSRMDELLKLTRESAHARGVIEGAEKHKPEFGFDPDEQT